MSLAALCAVGVVATAWSVLVGRRAGQSSAKTPASPVRDLPAQGIDGGPYLLVRSTSLDRNYGRLGLVARGDPQGPRMLSSLHCNRADFEGGRGLCLAQGTGLLVSTRATIFDALFHPLRTVQLAGYPSRTRVSPDGRYGAATTFVNGDSYATMGQFSTRTDIIDLNSGRVLFDLEKLNVSRGGRPFQGADFNYWGVTFAPDGHTFYATLGTGGTTYLIRADLNTRQATVLRPGVECPSLSPDGRRIAFKSRNPGAVVTWHLAVLDLATMKDQPLAETRNVDDQAAWLDNNTVMYGLVHEPDPNTTDAAQAGLPAMTTGASVATDTWATAATGAGRPRRLVPGAWSTTVPQP